jgi:hypothetical protein
MLSAVCSAATLAVCEPKGVARDKVCGCANHVLCGVTADIKEFGSSAAVSLNAAVRK